LPPHLLLKRNRSRKRRKKFFGVGSFRGVS
jgi:hypothetical protein